jgi:hypothetical protein
MVIEQSIENSKRSIEETIRQIASETFEEDRIGKITDVYPRSLKGERFTHECDVLLLSEDREIKNVQVSKSGMDNVSVPRKDDICIISYEGFRNTTPYISTFYNISRPRDEDKPDDISDNKRYTPLPALYGDYRIRKWGEGEIAITRDISNKKDKNRTDKKRDKNDDVQIKIGKHSGDFKDSGEFTDFDMSIELDLGKQTIKITNSENNMGFYLNMNTGEFKIGDGNQYGIESDGNGNFDWYMQSLDMYDDGTKMDWSDIE